MLDRRFGDFVHLPYTPRGNEQPPQAIVDDLNPLHIDRADR